MQELFDDQKVVRPKPKPGPENPSLDLTYLFEVNEGSGPHAVRDVPTRDVPVAADVVSGGTPLTAEEFATPLSRAPSETDRVPPRRPPSRPRSDATRAAPPPPPPVSRRIELPEFPDVITSPAVPHADDFGGAISGPLSPLDLMEAVALELDADAPPPPRFPPQRSPSGTSSIALPRAPSGTTPPQLKAPYRPTPSSLPADLFREPGAEELAVEEILTSNRAMVLEAIDEVSARLDTETPDTFEDDVSVIVPTGPSTTTRVLFLAGTLCGACLVWGMTVFFSRVAEPPAAERTAPVRAVVTPPAELPKPAMAPSTRGTFDLAEPRGARVFVDGVRLKKRVPIRGFAVEPGHREILVTKGRFRRWIEIDVKPGQHFDLTDREVREAEPSDAQ